MKIGGNICQLIHLICLIGTVICDSESEHINELLFRCQDTGHYMFDIFFCDGRIECPNGEDEIYGCNKNITCDGRKPFVCDQQCKELSVRCNGINDCEDGTDELNCGNRTNVKNCTSESQFLCKDGLRCLELYDTCDGFCNCFDCSDEKNINCSKHDLKLARECVDSYFTTAKGPQCFCNSSNDDIRMLCDRIQACDENHVSDNPPEYRCNQISDKIEFTCTEGFHLYIYENIGPELRHANSECRKNDWWETVIVYATEDKIRVLNVTSNTAWTIQDNVYNITALSTANNYTYYALKLPNDTGCIFKSSIHSGKSERIIDTGSTITSVAVDYITKIVYFTTNGSITVCKNDGSMCKKLVCCDIAAVTLAPNWGLMFYLKKEPKLNGFVLARSTMVGEKNKTISDVLYNADIFSLLADETTATLYLLEIYHDNDTQISKIKFDTGLTTKTFGSSVQTLGTYREWKFFTSREKRFKNYIFFTPRVDIRMQFPYLYITWLPYYIGDDNSTNISHMNVNNGILDNSKKNPCDKSSCSGLCLLRPDVNSSKFYLNYTCL